MLRISKGYYLFWFSFNWVLWVAGASRNAGNQAPEKQLS